MDTPPVPDWLRNANIAFGTPAPEPGNWLSSGLQSGFHGLLSDIGSLGQGIGSATGWQGLQQAGQGFAQSQQEAEKASENPYYEEHPWSLGGIGYTLAKSIPGLVPAVVGGALVPEAAVPAWLARVGAAAPRLLGGGAGLAEEAAGLAGKQFARGIVGGGVGLFPQIAGSNIQAEQGGDTSQPVSRGQALAALAVGAPEAALGGLFPESLFGASGGKVLGSKILAGAMTGAAVNAVNSGLQTGLNQFLDDTDKPIGERASDIVQSVLEGGVIGGVLGGATHGVQSLFRADNPPGAVSQDTKGVAATIDEALGRTPETSEAAPQPQTPAEMPSADLQAQFAALNAQETRSQGESAQHLLLGDEIAKRTQSGLNPGEGVLYEPDELATRRPLVEAMQAQVIPDDANPNDPLVKNFNAASEPELVNALQKRLTDGEAPQWITDLAKDRGIASDGKLLDLTPKINDLIEKYEKASMSGDTEKASTLIGRINDFSKLQQTHEQAIDLLLKANGATPEEIATHLSDIAAQSDSRLAEARTAAAQSSGPLSRGEPDAVPVTGPEGLHVLPTSEDGQALGERNAEGTTSGEGRGQAQEAVGDAQVQAPAKQFLTPVSRRGAQAGAVEHPAETRIRALAQSPLDLAMRGELTSDSAMERANALRDNEKAWQNEILGDKAARWRLLNRDVANSYSSERTAKANAELREIEKNLGLSDADVDHLYGDDVSQPRHSDPEDWRNLAIGLRNIEGMPNDRIDELARQTRNLPEQNDPERMTDNQRESLAVIQYAMSREAAAGRDPLVMMREAFGRQAEGYGGGADARELVAGNMQRLSSLLGQPIEAPAKQFLTPVSRRGAQAEPVPSLESRIRSAHAELTGGGLNGISYLNDLRAKLPDVSKEALDAELNRLHLDPDSGVFMSSGDNGPDRTPDRLLGGLNFKGELMIGLIANPRLIEEPPPPVRTIPPSDDPVADLKLLHDSEPDPDRKMYAAAALATSDPEKIGSALRALQIAKGFFRNESGSLNLGEIGRAWNKLTGKDKQRIAQEVEQPTKPMKASDMAENQPARTPQQMEGRIKDVSSIADLVANDTMQKVRDLGSDAPVWLRKQALIAQSLSGMVRIAGKDLKSSANYRGMHEQTQAIQHVKSKVDALAMRPYLDATPEQRIMADAMNAQMNDGSGLDPRKTWAEHPELHGAPNVAELIPKLQRMRGDWSRLQQKGGVPVLESILRMNQVKGYQEVSSALSLHGEIESTKGYAMPKGHADIPYQNMSMLHDDPQGTLDYYKADAYVRRDAIAKYINDQTALAQTVLKTAPARARNMLGDVERAQVALDYANERLAQIDRGTYSPLGHGRGDYFVAGKIATDDAGVPKSEAMAALHQALDKAGMELGLFTDGSNNTIMSRFKTMAQMERATKLFNDLEAQGHMVQGETRNGRPEDPTSYQNLGSKFIQNMIEGIHAAVNRSNLDKEIADNIKSRLTTQLLDTLPDHSIIPNMQKRTYAQGFDKDMGLVAAERATNSSRATTAISMSGRMADARAAMRAEVLAAQTDPNLRPKERLIGANVLNELMLREQQQAWRVPSSFFDTLRAMTHTIGIGANIGYTILPMSQILTLSHGELSKKYGFVKAAAALGQSASMAFKVMKAVAKGYDWATLGFRESDLRAAGIPEGVINTIMRLDNAGGLSTYNRLMGDLGEGANAKAEKFKDMANSLGSYAETFPRVLTALAAAKLHTDRYGVGEGPKGLTKDQYVKEMVDNSQFRWGPGEASRLTGGKGPLGSFGKLAFAFTQFRTKIIEKLYSEFHDLLAPGNSPEVRKEAGMFLASHLIATVTLAGSLGLPAAGLLAGVYDRIYGALTGKDDMDIEGTYRTWLADTFGKGAADVLAKGVPRALGIDLSHLGEQDLIPFTEAVQEKRKFEDASEDWFNHMVGPSINEIKDAVVGFRNIVNGDYMLGLQKALPGSLKDFAGAYRLNEYGHYINDRGQTLPITPGALAVLQEALGVKPANKAQYQEANEIKQGLLAQRLYRSQNIGTHLARAFNTGDTASIGPWIQEAMQYQIDHQMRGGPLQNLQRMILMSQRGQAQAQALGIPLGVKPQDIGLQSRLGFMGQ